MNTRSLLLFLSVLSLMVASCGSSSDNGTVGSNGGSGNIAAPAATGTAPVTFQFALAQQTQVPSSVSNIQFLAKNEQGENVLDETRQPQSSITLDIPTTASSCCLLYLSNSTPIFQGLVPFTLTTGEPLTLIAPLGDPVLPPVFDPIIISPTNSTLALNSTTSFVATSNGIDITSQGLFIASNPEVFRFDTPSSGSGISIGTSLITFNAPKRAPDLVFGAGSGAAEIKSRDSRNPDGGNLQNFFAYNPSFDGGVRVSNGDINGDGVLDIITAPGPGGPPEIRVFDGQSGNSLSSFFAYDSAFTGGVFVASGDVNNDGRDDIITGADAGAGPHVRVFSGTDNSVLHDFFAYDSSFRGGVRVGVGDVNADGFGDIITGAGPGGPPQVNIFDGRDSSNRLRSFFAFDPGFSGGLFVSGGDVNGDGNQDIIIGADAGGPPQVKIFDGQTTNELGSFFAYDSGFTGGVRVAAGDVNGDGNSDIITGPGPGSPPVIKIFDSGSSIATNSTTPTAISSFFGFNPSFSGGIFVSGSSSLRQVCSSSTSISVTSESNVVISNSSLRILTAPISGVQLQPFNPFFTVQVLDSSGAPVTNSTTVSIGISSLSSIPSTAQLRGTTAVQTVNGVASFIGLDVTEPGTYQFEISTSSSFITSNPVIVSTSSLVIRPSVLFVTIPGTQDVRRFSPVSNLGATSTPNLQFPIAGTNSVEKCAYDAGRDVLYVATQVGANPAQLAITSGAISTNPQTRLVGLNDPGGNPVPNNFPRALYLDSAADTIYVGGNNAVFAFSSASTLAGNAQAVRQITGLGVNVLGLAADPGRDRLFIASNNNNVGIVNGFSGLNGVSLATGQRAPGITNSSALAFDPGQNRLFVCDAGGNNVISFDVDPASAALTPGANFNVGGNSNAIGIRNGALFVSDTTSNDIVIFDQNNPPNPVSGVPLGAPANGVCLGN